MHCTPSLNWKLSICKITWNWSSASYQSQVFLIFGSWFRNRISLWVAPLPAKWPHTLAPPICMNRDFLLWRQSSPKRETVCHPSISVSKCALVCLRTNQYFNSWSTTCLVRFRTSVLTNITQDSYTFIFEDCSNFVWSVLSCTSVFALFDVFHCVLH